MTAEEYLKSLNLEPVIHGGYKIIPWDSCISLMEMYHKAILNLEKKKLKL